MSRVMSGILGLAVMFSGQMSWAAEPNTIDCSFGWIVDKTVPRSVSSFMDDGNGMDSGTFLEFKDYRAKLQFRRNLGSEKTRVYSVIYSADSSRVFAIAHQDLTVGQDTPFHVDLLAPQILGHEGLSLKCDLRNNALN